MPAHESLSLTVRPECARVGDRDRDRSISAVLPTRGHVPWHAGGPLHRSPLGAADPRASGRGPGLSPSGPPAASVCRSASARNVR